MYVSAGVCTEASGEEAEAKLAMGDTVGGNKSDGLDLLSTAGEEVSATSLNRFGRSAGSRLVCALESTKMGRCRCHSGAGTTAAATVSLLELIVVGRWSPNDLLTVWS